MDLTDIQTFVDDNTPDSAVGVELIMMQIGKLGEVMLHTEHGDMSDEEESEAFGQIAVGLLMVAVELANDNDVDIDEYVTDTVDAMTEENERDEELATAMEEGDYEKLAEMLLEDDAPADEEDAGGDTRAFQ